MAPKECPVIDFVELIIGASVPNTLLIAFNSAISPTGVLVPCVFIYDISLVFFSKIINKGCP